MYKLFGNIDGRRVPSKELEEKIQAAVKSGERDIHIVADGQHGIGGRIWPLSNNEGVRIKVEGSVGQRLGSMGMFGTEIVVNGNTSDDIGWINCGAKITVLGDVTNGAHNAAAQGILYVAGSGGARCDTMTKRNPRFEPLQSWYLRNVGDSFAEFKAGGTAVICGYNSRDPHNVLGYRPCVGMVGGEIYFRGHIKGYSESDVRCVDLSDTDWKWLLDNMRLFLGAIHRETLYDELTKNRDEWKKLISYTPAEKAKSKQAAMSMKDFRLKSWEKEVGRGGIFGELLDHELTVLPYVTTGTERRNRPEWNNDKYLPPCAYNCPTGIPTHRRTALIRQDRLEDALNLILQYTPFPASVCGEICPNICMQNCTRGLNDLPINIKGLGSVSLNLPAPEKAPSTRYRIGIIGGGPAGLSAAWQLALKGHGVDIYESESRIGGKVELCVPKERLPEEILEKEMERFKSLGVAIHTGKRVDAAMFGEIYGAHDAVIIAIGAHNPRKIRFDGSDDVMPGIEFLKRINFGSPMDLKGKRVAVIGAGNAGMDIACQAFNCGAAEVTAVDIQRPASFGKEQKMAKEKGTKILYPKVSSKFDKAGSRLYFTDGSSIDANEVIFSIGEMPITDFLPREIHTENGFITVNERYQTTDLKVYAIGDATKPGLVTDAIGHGRIAALALHAALSQYDYQPEKRTVIPYDNIKQAYYEACRLDDFKPSTEAHRCMSCGACRDCHMCEETCYHGAISRKGYEDGSYEYIVDADRCIGCGFCAGICPCGVWEMVENK